MNLRRKLGEIFQVKNLGMRLRIASAHLPYTHRDFLRIVCRIPSLYRKGCVARFELKMTYGSSLENRSSAGFLWAFRNWRNI